MERPIDKSLVEEVLRLAPADRMRLLNVIYRSLERPDTEIDEIWYDEAERRLSAYKEGGTPGLPAGEVLGDRP